MRNNNFLLIGLVGENDVCRFNRYFICSPFCLIYSISKQLIRYSKLLYNSLKRELDQSEVDQR